MSLVKARKEMSYGRNVKRDPHGRKKKGTVGGGHPSPGTGRFDRNWWKVDEQVETVMGK